MSCSVFLLAVSTPWELDDLELDQSEISTQVLWKYRACVVLMFTPLNPLHLWYSGMLVPLLWRPNERDGVSNYRCLGCLLNRLFRLRSKKTSKLRVTGLCEGNSPVNSEFPAQRASNVENISIWWRNHALWNEALSQYEQSRFDRHTAHCWPPVCLLTNAWWNQLHPSDSDVAWNSTQQPSWQGSENGESWYAS